MRILSPRARPASRSIGRRRARRGKKTAFTSLSSRSGRRVGSRPSAIRRASRGGRGAGGRGAAISRPESARRRGHAKVGRTRSARGLVPAAAPAPIEPIGRLPRRSESADEDNPREISPGRGAAGGDREPYEALDSEIARLDARTYLVATTRARRAVRRPRRDASEGLSAALDSEMAAMTGKAAVMALRPRTIGGTGASAGNALVSWPVGTRCAP